MNEELVKTPVYNADIGARILVECAFFLGLSQLDCSQDKVKEEIKAEQLRRGWKSQWPDTMSLVECVWRRGFNGRVEVADVKSIFDPNALQTFYSAAQMGWTSNEPEIGAIAILKHGEAAIGSASIVESFDDSTFDHIYYLDGYTTTGCFALKFAPTNRPHLLGFIIPPKYV